MRYIFIGDIHGEYGLLTKLWGVLKPAPEDVVVSLGDVIDRGPNSPGCLRFLREHNVTLVRGNHEQTYLNKYQRGRVSEYPFTLEQKDIRYIESGVPWLEFPEIGYVAMHAGVPAAHQMPSLDLKSTKYRNYAMRTFKVRSRDFTQAQVRLELDGVVPGDAIEQRLSEATLTSLVQLVHRRRGDFLSLDQMEEEDPHWSELYDGRFGKIVYGHTVFPGPHVLEHSIGIDLGAGFENPRLCALVVTNHDNKLREKFVIVS